jgi:hypothetical protein
MPYNALIVETGRTNGSTSKVLPARPALLSIVEVDRDERSFWSGSAKEFSTE